MSNEPITVLLVEDNPGDARLIQEMLAGASGTPFVLECVDRLATGIDRLVKDGIDGVLLDLSLPDSHGLDTFTRFHAHAPGVPIVVLTGLFDEAVGVAAVQNGAQDFLTKGQVDGNLLVRTIRYAIERKRAEEALRAAKDTAENLINSSLDMIISVDTNRNILEFNQAAERAFGYRKAEVVGKPIDLLYADPSSGARVHSNTMNDGAFADEVVNKRKNGETFHSYLSASVVHGVNSEIGGVMGISRDITERKRAEEELKTAHLQLIQSAKLESVGQLAAVVAHEVKNPLAIIQQGLGYLSRSTVKSGDATASEILEKMENAVKRADRVIRGLLDFSAPGALEMTPTQLNEVVEQSLLLVKHALVRGRVNVVSGLAENLPPIYLDRHKIEQVFVNLFMNAIQAMPGGGTLTVRTYTKQLAHGTGTPGEQGDRFRAGETVVVGEVEDTGTGIPADKLDRIFDPFFTTKAPGQGTGLGLSVTRKIVELHGGTIDITNRSEGGVRVSLVFHTNGGQSDAEEKDPTG